MPAPGAVPLGVDELPSIEVAGGEHACKQNPVTAAIAASHRDVFGSSIDPLLSSESIPPAGNRVGVLPRHLGSIANVSRNQRPCRPTPARRGAEQQSGTTNGYPSAARAARRAPEGLLAGLVLR